MQIETTLGYHVTPGRMAVIKNLQIINAGEGVKNRTFYTVGGNVRWCIYDRKHCGGSFKTWKQSCHMIQQSHSWAYIQRRTWFKKIHAAQRFTALFRIAKTWTQLRCPSADEWIKKMYDIAPSLGHGHHSNSILSWGQGLEITVLARGQARRSWEHRNSDAHLAPLPSSLVLYLGMSFSNLACLLGPNLLATWKCNNGVIKAVLVETKASDYKAAKRIPRLRFQQDNLKCTAFPKGRMKFLLLCYDITWVIMQ